MTPLHLETLLLSKVRHSLVTRLRILVTEEETSRVLIAFAVITCSRNTPGALRVDFTQEFQVPLVIDGKIISTISEIEATVAFITIGRHDKTTTVTLGKWEESVRDCQRHRHIAHHEISRSENHILTRSHLRSGKRNIEVGMRIITSRISTMLQIDSSRRITFRSGTRQESVLLLCIYIINKCLLTLEIEGYRIRIIGIRAHLEYRFTLDATFSSRVGSTRSLHIALVDVHGNLVTRKIHVGIFHI